VPWRARDRTSVTPDTREETNRLLVRRRPILSDAGEAPLPAAREDVCDSVVAGILNAGHSKGNLDAGCRGRSRCLCRGLGGFCESGGGWQEEGALCSTSGGVGRGVKFQCGERVGGFFPCPSGWRLLKGSGVGGRGRTPGWVSRVRASVTTTTGGYQSIGPPGPCVTRSRAGGGGGG